MKTYTIPCFSRCLSPMTQGSGVQGNAVLIARETIKTDRGMATIPMLSGNAIRHRCVREPGAMWLIQEYDLVGKMPLEFVNFLLHGGNLTLSTARINTKRIAEMSRTWPLLSLIGCTLPDQIVSGKLDVWMGTLVCEENRPVVESVLGEPVGGTLYPAERFISEWQYTRGDATGRNLESDAPRAIDPATNLMIFAGQCVSRNAAWAHGFVLKHASDLEVGAFLWSLRLWQAAGGTIGGMAARGHGRLDTSLVGEHLPQDELCAAYVDHVRSVKDDAIAWLDDAFAGAKKKVSRA